MFCAELQFAAWYKRLVQNRDEKISHGRTTAKEESGSTRKKMSAFVDKIKSLLYTTEFECAFTTGMRKKSTTRL